MASRGQRINITLINFARVTPLSLSSSPPGGGGQGPLIQTAHVSTSPVIARPKICYQLANFRERQHSKLLTECEGSPRESHAFLSNSDVVEVDITIAKVLKVYFLLHFEGKLLISPFDLREGQELRG
jgi:hypothetical protein